jgi:tol-pal system protein YbgF
MRRYLGVNIVLMAMLAAVAQAPANAALFDDDEARKAIFDLRARVDANQQDVSSRIDKVQQGQLDTANQIEQLKEDLDKLRGQIELLNNAIATQDKRSKDYYTDLDTRLRKLEPQAVSIDGRSGTVDNAEQQRYDSAVAQLKSNDFKGSQAAFSNFIRDYPNSVYLPSAQYYMGASLYAQRDYKAAIATQEVVVKNWPDSQRAADALFNIGNAQTDMGNRSAARKTFENLLAAYPDSPAAGAARDKLATLR